jgi:DNA-binding sugar fermentation-stimulating protein
MLQKAIRILINIDNLKLNSRTNMQYRYAVFISYKWNGEYDEWVNKIFYPIVQEYFISKFSRNDLVFKDTMESRKSYGNSVIDFLKEGLVHSKCMIAVLNGPYFCGSIWCPKEFR